MMKKAAVVLLCLIAVSLYAKSIWTNGFSFYQTSVKEGDIITVRFSDKTLMNYNVQQKRNDFQSESGKKGSGDLFSFFPNAEVKQNDTVKNQNNLNVNNQNRFQIPAKVTAVNGRTAVLQGLNSSLVNGESFRVEFTGEADFSSLQSDGSILSTDIYNLDFKIFQETPTNTSYFQSDDLVFQTNYNEIFTNQVVDPTNNTTNSLIVTNLANFKLEFKGIRDEKKKDLLANYLNGVIQALFR
jgi:hypothetical protein